MAQVFDVTECFANQLEKSFLLSSMQAKAAAGPQVLECDLEAFQHHPPYNSNLGLCLSL